MLLAIGKIKDLSSDLAFRVVIEEAIFLGLYICNDILWWYTIFLDLEYSFVFVNLNNTSSEKDNQSMLS